MHITETDEQPQSTLPVPRIAAEMQIYEVLTALAPQIDEEHFFFDMVPCPKTTKEALLMAAKRVDSEIMEESVECSLSKSMSQSVKRPWNAHKDLSNRSSFMTISGTSFDIARTPQKSRGKKPSSPYVELEPADEKSSEAGRSPSKTKMKRNRIREIRKFGGKK